MKAALQGMEIDSTEDKIRSKIEEVAKVANFIPAVVIIHALPEFSVHYLSETGLKFLGITLADVEKMSSQEYHSRYFNPDDASDYVPKIQALLERNNDEIISFFQQVRPSPDHKWAWYLSAIRILLRDDTGKPLLTITTATPIDPKHHVTSKVSRLLDENNFLRNNYHQFARLTKRERDVLRLLALGKSSGEIAEQLFISVTTAETHRRNIKQKLDASNIFELSQYARAFDLI